MTDRAHIRNGQIIRRYEGEKGKVLLEDGNVAMPVVLGYTNGNDKVVPWEVITNDTSTGTDSLRSVDVTVMATKVKETITIRDKTQAELDAEAESQKEDAMDTLEKSNSRDKALAQAIFRLANDVRALEGKQPITAAQFRAYLKGLL